MNMNLNKYRTFFLFSMLVFLFIVPNTVAQETIRVMSYNMMNYAGDTGRDAYFITVLDQIEPDICVGIELKSETWGENFRDNVLNQIGNGTYNMGTYIGSTSNNNAIFYRSDKFTFVSSTNIIGGSGKPRTHKYILTHNSTGKQFIIFGVHLPSGSDEERVTHVDAIRSITDAYASGEFFIAAGDFNIDDSTEVSFNHLVDDASSGYFIDPVSWYGNGRLKTHNNTKSTWYRHDMILNSQSIVNSGGIEYVTDSYTVPGNIDGTSASVPQVYKDASDHQPVYADYYVDSPGLNWPTPGSIVFTQVGTDNPDVVEFLTLADMSLTNLKITNSGVDINGGLVNGDGTFNLINTNWTDIPAGTFVRLGIDLTNDNDYSDRIIQYDGAGSSPPTLSTGSAGDQLIAYTGSETVPTYIAGIIWGNDGWLTGPSNSHAPGTPSDIELGSLDNYYFNGSVNGDANVTRAAIMNTSSWTGSNGRIGLIDLTGNIGNSAFPVELTFFAGTLNGNNVELNWRTETEVNNFGFEIQRQSNQDGLDGKWITLGFVEGQGNSNSPKEYNFGDTDINQPGKYFYRLKQLDSDGKYEYSDVVTVTVDVPVLYTLNQNYPNPFNPETKIEFTLPEKQLISLRIYNTLGEFVRELVNEEREAGSYSVIFDASNLSSGIYIYSLVTQNFVLDKKMTLLK